METVEMVGHAMASQIFATLFLDVVKAGHNVSGVVQMRHRLEREWPIGTRNDHHLVDARGEWRF
jgi:hypothetical protein